LIGRDEEAPVGLLSGRLAIKYALCYGRRADCDDLDEEDKLRNAHDYAFLCHDTPQSRIHRAIWRSPQTMRKPKKSEPNSDFEVC
jgi:hypothetical protein